MVNVKRAAESVAKLALLKFFPSDESARLGLVRMVCEMAGSDDQVDWLVRRMLVLYNEWPGPRELRACYCSRFKPADGIEARSEVFVEGIPSEKQAPALKALPPGSVTADRGLDQKMRLLAERKAL